MNQQILEQILEISNQKLDLLNTDYVNQYNFFHDHYYFHLPSGKEHYRLLMFISSLYNKQYLFDIGTYRCLSAAALSFGKNKIKSYDINIALPINPIMPGVEYFIGDVSKDEDLLKSNFIFLDTLHDGIFENILYDHLKKINWKGLLMLDDIYVTEEMKIFWNNFTEEKYDISKKGHWAGTGLVNFK